MPKIDLKQLYLQLELEINRLSSSTLMIYREDLREDTHEVIKLLKKDIDKWVKGLNERNIACFELEGLLEEQRSNIELTRLKSKGVHENEIDNLKNDVLRLLARAIMNSYLENLFRNQNANKHENDILYEH
ncbi:MAG: hypothetical protein JXR27_00840 [Paludibacteraceae bacterium]|nr:hypothetical protein [Paludibacteraceae bacterium]